MNKYIFLVFALFAVISSGLCGDSSEEVINKVKNKHLKKLLTDKKEDVDSGLDKLEEKCPGVTEKLKSAVNYLVECDINSDESLTICAAIQTQALNCTKPLLKVIEDCIPQAAKGLPTLGFESLVSVADFLCKQTGESIFELGNPCLWEDLLTDGSGEQQEVNAECEKKVTDFIEQHEEAIPTKTEICTTAADLRSCVKSETQRSCKNQKTKDVVIGLYDAIIAPCSHINEA